MFYNGQNFCRASNGTERSSRKAALLRLGKSHKPYAHTPASAPYSKICAYTHMCEAMSCHMVADPASSGRRPCITWR